jgi:hypothetical protein
VVKAQRWSQLKQQVSQVLQLDVVGGVWVVLSPALSEPLIHLIVEESAVLRLDFLVALKDNGNEELEEDHADQKHKRYQVNRGAYIAATTHCLEIVVSIILVARVVNALVRWAFWGRKGHEVVVPRVHSRHSEQGDERTCEGLKVNVVVHRRIPLQLSEVDHPDDRVDVHHEKEQATNIRQGLHGDHKSVKDQVQTLATSL